MIRSHMIWLLAVIGLCPLMAQLRTEGDDSTPEHSQGPLVPLSGVNHPARILWDTSHGVLLDYEPSGRFSDLTALLAAKEQIVETSNSGVLSLELRQYTSLVISLGSSWDSAYSDIEADLIYDWVLNGGNLLILSDNSLAPLGNIAAVADRFGVTFTDVPLFPGILYIDHFSSHPMMAGLSRIYINAGGDHLIESPMERAAWDPDGRIVVSVGQFGGGHVVVIGDNNCLTNGALPFFDNQLFAENVFDALTVATVPTLSTPYLIILLLGLGGLAVLRARTHRTRAQGTYYQGKAPNVANPCP